MSIRLLLVFLLSIVVSSSVGAMPNEQIWKYFNLTEEKILNKKFGLFYSNQPIDFHQESIAYRLHSFCYYFIKLRFPNYVQVNHRNGMESLIWNHYYSQASTLRTQKPEFNCISSESLDTDRIQISFQLNADQGFEAYKWVTYSRNILISIGIDEFRTGNPTSITQYHPNKLNCILSKTQDTNFNGIPDVWYNYENCTLISHKEDFNENGNIERKCKYDQNGNIVLCEGIGEKNLLLAKQYEEQENWVESIRYYNRLIEDYMSEFKEKSRHICEPNYKILQFQYNLLNYTVLDEHYDALKSNPYCKKELKKSQIFIGIINLYSLGKLSLGVEQLEDANKSYKEERGWDSIEINLALSYGYLNLKQYPSCLSSLQKIAGRPFNQKGRFFYNYYFGSCKLGNKQFHEALPCFRIALESTKDSKEKSIVLYKLGVLYLFSPSHYDQVLSKKYFQSALKLNPELLPAIENSQKEHRDLQEFSNKP